MSFLKQDYKKFLIHMIPNYNNKREKLAIVNGCAKIDCTATSDPKYPYLYINLHVNSNTNYDSDWLFNYSVRPVLDIGLGWMSKNDLLRMD